MADTRKLLNLSDEMPSEQRVSILLVDDQPANLLALEAILHDLGHHLVRANSGEEALQRLKNTDFALVLLDVQMPGLDGFETARLIRGQEESRHTPIIFLTAFESDRFPVEQAYSLGAVDYLVKPLVPVIVRAKVAGFVELFEKTRQVRRQAERLRQMERQEYQQALAEEAARLREQKEQWRTTLHSIGDAVLTTDAEGRVTSLNPVAEALTGWPQQEAAGQPLDRVFPIVHEATGQPVENPVARVLREGAVVGLGNHTLLIARDGTRRPIDDSAAPVKDAQGRLTGVVLVFRDVTEQRRAEKELRASEARKAAVLETALDAIISIDHEDRIIEFNPAAERLFGYARADVLGRPMAELIVPPSLREAHHRGMAHYLATGEGPVLGKRIEMPALRADGMVFPVELAITRILTDGPPVFTAYLRDISERTRIEAHRNARLAVNQVLAEAPTVGEAATGVLQAVCESLGWDVGFFWILEKEAGPLRCLESWHLPGLPFTEFEAISRGRTFRKGEGLPGHVWATGKPTWLPDVATATNFPRAASAAKEGLHGAFACPVTVGHDALGVIEFFSRQIREPDAGLLEMMATVAAQVGQFVERKQAEERLRRSERELADFFETASIGLHWVGPDGTILRANRAELDLLGYSPEEYVGHHIAEFHADPDVICDILRRLQSGERLYDYPARMRCKDGSLRDVLIHSSVLFEQGRFVHTRCFTRDVTEQKRAEEALKASAERLNLALSAADLGDWSWDAASDVVTFSERAADIFGIPPGPHMTWTAMQGLLHEEDRERARREVERAVAERSQYDIEYRVNRADGSQVWVAALGRARYDDAGHALGIYGVVRDITGRKRLEEALRESEERFRGLMEQAPFSVQVFAPDGRTIRVNRAWEELWGVTLDQIDGYNVLEDRQLEAKGILPYLQRAFAGEPVEIPAIRYDPKETVPHVTWQQDPSRWVSAVAYPLKDQGGQVREVVLVHQNITERKRAEEALRESEEKFRLMAETIPQLAWMARPDGHIFWYNRRWYEYTGMTLEQMEGWGWQAVHDPDVLPRVVERWKASLASGEPFDMVFPLKGADGRFRPFLTRVNPLRDEAGRILYWFGTNTDISEIKAMEAALREADRLKDEFLAMLAHELRNPLAPIRNALHVMKMPGANGAMVGQVRDMAERQVQHMARLLDDLLDVSRISRGKIELRKEVLDLTAVVNRSVEAVRPLFEQRQHQLTVSLPPEPIRVEADPTRLEQVVTNLLHNAAKYTDPGGKVWLTAEREGGEVVLRVKDTGIGIAPDMLPKIFDLFVQAERRLDRSQGGVGIGLTLVRRLVELHGGAVDARSAGPGQGSEFVVRLPAAPEGPAALRAGDGSAEANAPRLPSRRVLVVDDNVDAADSIAMILKLAGQEVRVAYDGPTALLVAQAFRPQVVLLDIGMPGMDGYEVARRLPQLPEGRPALVVALTGWGQETDQQRSREAGFDHHLVKPVEPGVLRSLLAAV